MAKRDYYEVLEITRSASDGEIKSSFRKLAMKWHPDKNPGDQTCEHKFREINEAYDVLKDGDRRAAYDRVGPFSTELWLGDFLDWWARAIDCGLESFMLPDVTLLRRVHGDNVGVRRRDERSEYARVLKTILDRRRGAH